MADLVARAMAQNANSQLNMINQQVNKSSIDDSTTSTEKAWSSAKTQAQIQLIPKGDKGDAGTASVAINDDVTNLAQTWSSSKINDKINSCNTELLDVRLGADGRTYSSAGMAIREHFKLFAKFETSFYTLSDGYYIGASGVATAYAPLSMSNLIELNRTETITVITSYNNPNNVSALYKYTSSEVPLKKLFSANGAGVYTYTATEEKEYIKFSGTTSDLKAYKYFGGIKTLEYIFTDYASKSSLANLDSKINVVVENNNIKNSIIKEINTEYLSRKVKLYGKTGLEPSSLTTSFYNGTSIGFVSPKYLNKIRVKIKADTTTNKVVKAVLTTKTVSQWISISDANNYNKSKSWFEENMADIISTSEYTGLGAEQMVEFNFNNYYTNNQLVRVVIYFVDSDVKIYHCNVNLSGNFDTDKYNQYISYMPDNLFVSSYKTDGTSVIVSATNAYAYSLYAEIYECNFEQTDAFYNSIKDDYLKCIFDKVLCIGDSLTYGGAGKIGAEKNINYPRYLSKLSNWTVDSKAYPGRSVTDIWDILSSDNTDYTQYDAVVLFLGTNVVKYDTVISDSLTDTLVSDTNAIGYINYANTATGNYCKIIEYILSKNPYIKIYVCGLTYQPRIELNNIIKQIANKYIGSNVVFLDLYNNGYYDLRQYIYHQYYNSTSEVVHFGKIGCLTLAKVIYNLIIKSISDTPVNYELPYKV